MKLFLSSILLLQPVMHIFSQQHTAIKQLVITARSTRILQVDGLQFKDLNKNGKLDVYEDWRKLSPVRAKDLVSQMTLEEKAGAALRSADADLK